VVILVKGGGRKKVQETEHYGCKEIGEINWGILRKLWKKKL
jgi:hypothetical protein